MQHCLYAWMFAHAGECHFHCPLQPNYLENRGPREPGNYDNYIAYLDKLKMQRQERERELNQRKESMFSFYRLVQH